MSNELDFLDEFDEMLDEEHAEEIPMPVVQWMNGKKAMAKLHPVMGSGGFELPFEDFGQTLSDAYEVVEVTHGDGNGVLAYLLDTLHIAIIARRFTWQVYRDGRSENLDKYEPGAVGRYHYYCFVKELGSAIPVMLTFRGVAGQRFDALRKDHLKNVVGLSRQLTGRPWPQYAFWMPVQAGPVEQVGKEKKSPITPPVAAWNKEALTTTDKDALTETLKPLFVGGEFFAAAKATKGEAETWAMLFKAGRQSGGRISSDPVTQFWAYVNDNGLTDEVGRDALGQAEGDPVLALELLTGEKVKQTLAGQAMPEQMAIEGTSQPERESYYTK